MAKIGILGGTFDPIHNGHLLLGQQAYEEYGLDEIWYMPSGQPPHKKDHSVTPAFHRCAMVRLALEGREGFRLSEFETLRQGTTYTAQTLKLLKEKWPFHEFSFIIGADSLYQMNQWYHPEEVLAAVEILVAGRQYEKPHDTVEEKISDLTGRYGGCIRRLHCPEINISSEHIRGLIRAGESIRGLVPPAVEEYIDKNRLYLEDAI